MNLGRFILDEQTLSVKDWELSGTNPVATRRFESSWRDAAHGDWWTVTKTAELKIYFRPRAA